MKPGQERARCDVGNRALGDGLTTKYKIDNITKAPDAGLRAGEFGVGFDMFHS